MFKDIILRPTFSSTWEHYILSTQLRVWNKYKWQNTHNLIMSCQQWILTTNIPINMARKNAWCSQLQCPQAPTMRLNMFCYDKFCYENLLWTLNNHRYFEFYCRALQIRLREKANVSGRSPCVIYEFSKHTWC